MKLYVASSWRNARYPTILAALRAGGHDCYDFRNPEPGNHGFAWSEIDPNWQSWTPEQFRLALDHPIAEGGFSYDWSAMRQADGCVLVMPCGRSAHIEAGYFVGAHKPLMILLNGEASEPELMYKMASAVCTTTEQVLWHLRGAEHFLEAKRSRGMA